MLQGSGTSTWVVSGVLLLLEVLGDAGVSLRVMRLYFLTHPRTPFTVKLQTPAPETKEIFMLQHAVHGRTDRSKESRIIIKKNVRCLSGIRAAVP